MCFFLGLELPFVCMWFSGIGVAVCLHVVFWNWWSNGAYHINVRNVHVQQMHPKQHHVTVTFCHCLQLAQKAQIRQAVKPQKVIKGARSTGKRF